MFKRPQAPSPPPTAPTFAQILDDLESFQSEKPPLEQTRTLDVSLGTSSSSGAESVANINEWWKTFETFQSDVRHLKHIRREFKQARAELIEANADIVKHSEHMKQQIAEALAKAEDN